MDDSVDKAEVYQTLDESDDLLINDEGAMDILMFASSGLVDMYGVIPEEDLDDTTVSVNAGKIADCLEMLLAYAEIYEGLKLDELLENSEIDRHIGKYQFTSTLVH